MTATIIKPKLVVSDANLFGDHLPAKTDSKRDLGTRILLDMYILHQVTSILLFLFTPMSVKSNNKITQKSSKTPFLVILTIFALQRFLQKKSGSHAQLYMRS